ncbi:hypothetical protein GGX14DRAFT_401150 [Mycena pura]|uniref:Uncharacterized protein n=1 Tax=Mycena pura TaxID=153505 RepID=A0AAD6V8C7_9AGAR|nr:hypothetical protein GGX14DRAFT_401150 [Mycena pura]
MAMATAVADGVQRCWEKYMYAAERDAAAARAGVCPTDHGAQTCRWVVQMYGKGTRAAFEPGNLMVIAGAAAWRGWRGRGILSMGGSGNLGVPVSDGDNVRLPVLRARQWLRGKRHARRAIERARSKSQAAAAAARRHGAVCVDGMLSMGGGGGSRGAPRECVRNKMSVCGVRARAGARNRVWCAPAVLEEAVLSVRVPVERLGEGAPAHHAVRARLRRRRRKHGFVCAGGGGACRDAVRMGMSGVCVARMRMERTRHWSGLPVSAECAGARTCKEAVRAATMATTRRGGGGGTLPSSADGVGGGVDAAYGASVGVVQVCDWPVRVRVLTTVGVGVDTSDGGVGFARAWSAGRQNEEYQNRRRGAMLNSALRQGETSDWPRRQRENTVGTRESLERGSDYRRLHERGKNRRTYRTGGDQRNRVVLVPVPLMASSAKCERVSKAKGLVNSFGYRVSDSEVGEEPWALPARPACGGCWSWKGKWRGVVTGSARCGSERERDSERVEREGLEDEEKAPKAQANSTTHWKAYKGSGGWANKRAGYSMLSRMLTAAGAMSVSSDQRPARALKIKPGEVLRPDERKKQKRRGTESGFAAQPAFWSTIRCNRRLTASWMSSEHNLKAKCKLENQHDVPPLVWT